MKEKMTHQAIQKDKILKFLQNSIIGDCTINDFGILRSINHDWAIIVQNDSLLFKSGLRKTVTFKYNDVTCFEQITILANMDSNENNKRYAPNPN